MADELLRAGQVAAMRERSVGGWREAMWDWQQQDTVALCAQDGRWRALVGRMMPFMQHLPTCPVWACEVSEYCNCRVHDALAQAQAALDGAAPPTRGDG